MYNCYMCGIELNKYNTAPYSLQTHAKWRRCRDCTAYVAKSTRLRRKQRIHDYYGNCCTICGTTDNLVIDHIDGQGNQHRLQEKLKGGTEFYAWIEQNSFPNSLQLLCRKHNFMKTYLSMEEFILECKYIAKMYGD